MGSDRACPTSDGPYKALVQALDRYYLGITILVTLAYQLVGFAIAWTFKFDKITDFTGGSNFLILAVLTLCIGNTFYARNIVAGVLVMVWASRIAGFLLFRVLKTGKDARFDDIRSHFWKFLAFWVGQILWVWTVSLPTTILNSPAVSDPSLGGSNPAFGTSRDVAGIIVWGVGFLIESIADAQKYMAKSTGAIPKGHPMNKGLWGWSRHPPYFGEMLCWWGIWMLCLSPTTSGSLPFSARAAQDGAVVSPIFTFLILMFGSGVPTAERPTAQKFYLMSHGPQAVEGQQEAWGRYKEYLNSTSILIPMPPSFYRRLPAIVKHAVLLDFPLYRFREEEVLEGQDLMSNAA